MFLRSHTRDLTLRNLGGRNNRDPREMVLNLLAKLVLLAHFCPFPLVAHSDRNSSRRCIGIIT